MPGLPLYFRFILFACWIPVLPVAGQVPQAYQKVDHLLWVVGDLEGIVNGWKELGFEVMPTYDTLSFFSDRDSTHYLMQMAMANLGGARVVWIQPLENESVFARFHQDYGDGVMSLVHRLDGQEALEAEVKRLEDSAVQVLDEVILPLPGGPLHYTLMETRAEGKYVLGLMAEENGSIDALTPENKYDLKLLQYAFTVRQVEPVSAYWQKLGLGPIEVEPSEQSEKMYRGEATGFEIDLAWQRHGEFPYEWVVPVKSPNIQEDHLAQHGEGFHHLGYLVGNIQPLDPVLKAYAEQGIFVAMSAAWGNNGLPGSGHFRMMDTDRLGGVILELLWGIRRSE